MATRSLIGILLPSNEIEYAYCHWDGYPSHNGKILLNYYNTFDKVLDLIDLSDINSLEENLEDIETYDDYNSKLYFAKSEEDFLNKNHGSDYKYLFKNDQWYFSSYKDIQFKKLTEEDIKSD